jgi:hypothetical protein
MRPTCRETTVIENMVDYRAHHTFRATWESTKVGVEIEREENVGNCHSFCLCKFDYSTYFIKVELYNMSFVTGLFYFT